MIVSRFAPHPVCEEKSPGVFENSSSAQSLKISGVTALLFCYRVDRAKLANVANLTDADRLVFALILATSDRRLSAASKADSRAQRAERTPTGNTSLADQRFGRARFSSEEFGFEHAPSFSARDRIARPDAEHKDRTFVVFERFEPQA